MLRPLSAAAAAAIAAAAIAAAAIAAAAIAAAAIAAAIAVPALAQDAAPAASPAGGVAVELNALRQVGEGCQAYFVVRNGAGAALTALELDAFMFDAAEVIVDRLALPFSSVGAGKMKVAVFDLSLACTDITRVFVNEVLACETAAGACADSIVLSSRAPVQLED